MDPQTWMSLPMGANPETDRRIGMNELGEPVFQTILGQQYSMTTVQPEPLQGEPGSWERVKAVLGGIGSNLVSGAVDAVSAPARALRGEPVTYGDALNTAGVAQLGSFAGTAPSGAVHSGLARTADNAARRQADEIMDYLRSGRGAQVTDDMMAAADQSYLSQIYDLPLDRGARISRAMDSGYEINYPLFHGTSADAAAGIEQRGFSSNAFGSPRRRVADDYADNAAGWGEPQVVEFVGRPEFGGVDLDMPGASLVPFDDATGGFRAAYENGESMGFLPHAVRDLSARFDPRLSHLSNLTASNVSPISGLSVLSYPALTAPSPDRAVMSPVVEALISRGRQ